MRAAVVGVVFALAAGGLSGPAVAEQVTTPVAAAVVQQAPVPAAAAPLSRMLAAGSSPAAAVSAAASYAASRGSTAYISVVDRTTGAVLAQTGNAGTQVGSESIMKLMLAAYYLVVYGGYQSTPQSVLDQLSYMLRYSDDATASSLFTSSAIPTIAARYGMNSTTNATDRPGHWGAARITAADMARFLYRSSRDAAVGPWLIPVMSQTAPSGSDGFNQSFGLNALGGVHGSKQGWGCDSFFTAQPCAIHSVGYTDKYFVSVLQLSDSGHYPDPMRGSATYAAGLIQASTTAPPPPPPLRDGDFVLYSGSVYRMAGGAPIYVSSWASVGGSKPTRTLTAAAFGALRQLPVDGTVIAAGGTVFVIAGGAPVPVTDWAQIGGTRPYTTVDPVAVARAGTGGAYNHLRFRPADGTAVVGSGTVFVFAGGAPVAVTNWSAVGGSRPATLVDGVALARAGSGGAYNHVLFRPADGTAVVGSGTVFVFAGGAPVAVTDWSAVGGSRPATLVDGVALARAGSGGAYNHVLFRPADGTAVVGSGTVFVFAGGAPVAVTSWAAVGGSRPATLVDGVALARAGSGGAYDHVSFRPADGTFVVGGGQVYRMAGGAPLYVTSWAPLGSHPTTAVDLAALNRANSGGVFNHLLFYPADGTKLVGMPGAKAYQVSGGVARATGGAAVGTQITQATIDRAGTGGAYAHLRAA